MNPDDAFLGALPAAAVPEIARVASQLDASTPSADDILAESGPLDHSSVSVWSILPLIARRLGNPQEVPAGNASPNWGRMRNVGRGTMRRRGPELIRVGPVLFLSSGIQTSSVLWPVMDELADTLGSPQRYRLPPLCPLQTVDAQRAARRALRDLRRWLRRSGIAEPVGLEEEATKVEIMARRAGAAAFDEAGIRALVVATQHNSPTRAVIAAVTGISDGPATCYVPHAPVADNPYYRDLPVHYALLHGSAEVDFYRRLGVDDAERVRVVGQPGLQRPPEGLSEYAEHIIYAASGYAERVLRADIEVILRGVDRSVEVCLHPRMSMSDARKVFPDEWTVHPPGKTLEVLRTRGAFALIQHGSGVGLEAMSAGVDVIDLCPSGERPNYPYLAPPHVQLASDDVELRRAMAAIPGRRETRVDRIRYARSWCSMFDPEASAAAAEAIKSIADKPRPRDLLLDGWGMHATR